MPNSTLRISWPNDLADEILCKPTRKSKHHCPLSIPQSALPAPIHYALPLALLPIANPEHFPLLVYCTRPPTYHTHSPPQPTPQPFQPRTQRYLRMSTAQHVSNCANPHPSSPRCFAFHSPGASNDAPACAGEQPTPIRTLAHVDQPVSRNKRYSTRPNPYLQNCLHSTAALAWVWLSATRMICCGACPRHRP